MNPRDNNVPNNGRDGLPLVRVSNGASPHEIEVHIEELVLHGFAVGDRWRIGDALESELRGLLAERGVPPAWLSSPGRIDAGEIGATGLTRSAVTGAAIAGAAYRGGAR
jgi:hypothetical protein